MAKTEVILTHNIVGLGGESDQVRVAAGYARNYLFPQGLAIPLSGANKRRIEALKQRRAEREAHELNTMNELAKSVRNFPPLIIKVKTGDDGKLFGSVTSGTIADELKHQFDVALDKRKIHLEHPIRALGEHEVELRLHTDVNAVLKVRLESITPIAVPEAAAKTEEAPKTEKRGKRKDAAEAAPAEAADTKEKKPKSAKTKKAE
ncbi:MAG TPA: 50S ribosomal protein L9 [Dongiaceae bacterium]|jgi:large subunit ribosomal protein L9|nr:50S ribosomal protein L9 [Dongiaceae bacterium]